MENLPFRSGSNNGKKTRFWNSVWKKATLHVVLPEAWKVIKKDTMAQACS